MDEVKRPLAWIDAAAALLDQVPGARCIIVGDGPFRIKAERRAEPWASPSGASSSAGRQASDFGCRRWTC